MSNKKVIASIIIAHTDGRTLEMYNKLQLQCHTLRTLFFFCSLTCAIK